MTPQAMLGMAVSLLDSLGLLQPMIAFIIMAVAFAMLNKLMGRD